MMKLGLRDCQVCLGICLLGDVFGAIDEQRKIGGGILVRGSMYQTELYEDMMKLVLKCPFHLQICFKEEGVIQIENNQNCSR